jgi:hypothetical protein
LTGNNKGGFNGGGETEFGGEGFVKRKESGFGG